MYDHESFLKKLTIVMTDGLIVHDHEFTIIDMNAAAERIFGIRAEEIIGKKFLTDASRFLKNKRAPTPRTPYATAVIQVHAPQPDVTASNKTIPKNPKAKLPNTPNRLENGIIVASIGSKFGGRKGIRRKRKNTTQPSRKLNRPAGIQNIQKN